MTTNRNPVPRDGTILPPIPPPPPGEKMRRSPSRWRLGLVAASALLLAVVVPAAAGTSTALAQDSGVTLSPVQGPAGTQVTATGTGWTPGDTIEATWNGVYGNELGTVVVQPGGTFELTFTVPSDTAPVAYSVAFWDEDQQYFESATFDVTPSAPADVSVVPYGALHFYVTWTNTYPDASYFQVYNGVTSQYVSSDAVQDGYLWTVSQPGTYMCFAVRAIDDFASPWAGMWTCASTPGGGQPAAPTNVVATGISSNTIQLSFVNQAANETAFLFYNGVTTQSDTYSYDVPGKGSTSYYDWTGLQPDTYMCFKVAAYNEWGSSEYVPSTWACTSTKS
jgi:hypothetical protein